MKKIYCLLALAFFLLPIIVFSQSLPGSQAVLPVIATVEPQPLLAQAIRLDDALSFLGNA